jgi:hypothetical protein
LERRPELGAVKAAVLAGTLILASGLAGCSSDCQAVCERQLECGAVTGSLADCKKACELRAEELSAVDQVAKCADCYEGKSCNELFPTEPAVPGPICDEACGR